MEQKYSAPVETVYAMLTDPKWLEARCLELGELSAKIRSKKSAGGVTLTMTRRVRRELPALIAKVMPNESDLHFEEKWKSDGDGGYEGVLSMEVDGQPVRMNAEFSLTPSGKGCVYAIEHETKCSIPILGGTIARFAQGQIEEGCAQEFAYTAKLVKKAK